MADDEKTEKANELLDLLNKRLRESSDVYLSLNSSIERYNKIINNNIEFAKKTKLTDEQQKNFKTQLEQATRTSTRTLLADEKAIHDANRRKIITDAERDRLLEETAKNFSDVLGFASKEEKQSIERTIRYGRALEKINFYLNNEVTRALGSFASSILKSATSAQSGLEFRIATANTTFDLAFKLISSAAGQIPILGDGIKAVLGAIGEAGKVVLDVFATQAKNLANALRTSSAAGFVFADGLTGLRTAANNAGLTADVFTKALLENREAVVQFGGNLTEGAKRIGRVTQLLNIDRLQQLGVGLDEIPGLVAEVGARMRLSGQVTDKEVARQTEIYASNLRVIAELTGQDAKTLKQKAEANERDLAFQQFLATKTPQEAEAIRQQLQLLPDSAQEIFKEMAQTGGAIFSESGNILAQQAPAIADMARRLFSAVQTGGVTQDTSIQILKDLGTAARDQIKQTRDFATAAAVVGGPYKEVGEKLAASFKFLQEIDFTKLDEVRKAVERAGADDPTSAQLREEERKGMREMVDIQNLVNDRLSTYLGLVAGLNKPVEILTKAFEALADNVPRTQIEERNREALRRNIPIAEQVGETTRLRSRLGVTGTIRSSEINEQAMADQSLLNRYLEGAATRLAVSGKIQNDRIDTVRAYLREHMDDPEYLRIPENLRTGLATGGISSGPNSGYLAKLHGTEAVLPENLTEMLMDAAKSAQSVKEQLPTAVNARNMSEEILADINTKFYSMIDILNSISGHTENTAMRVA